MPQVVIKLPDFGEGTAQAELAAWHVKVGDTVAEDQNLAEITTDKATVEIPSPASGKVVSLRGTPGDVIAVGSPLIILEIDGPGEAEPVPAEKAPGRTVSIPSSPPPSPRAASENTEHASRQLAPPAVRERAKSLNIDLVQVSGTGPEGRINHKDLDAHILAQRPVHPVQTRPSQAVVPMAMGGVQKGVEEIKIIGIRRKIAERMLESKRRVPHYSYVEEVDVTALEELRAKLNATYGAARAKLSVLPFVMRALVKALADFPQINAHFDDEAGILRQFKAVHIGIATQTDKGLVVPVVFNAEDRDLWGLAGEVARVANSVRGGTPDRKDLNGSTITITSLGRLGGIVTTPVVNRPEVAIIGINKVVERPVVHQGQIVVRKMMNLSSSFDHRIVDGSVAAELIQQVKNLLENSSTLST